MPIPERLTPGKATKNRTQRLLKLLDEISSTLEDNGDQENDRVRELILQWNEIACREHDFHEFRDFHAYTAKMTLLFQPREKLNISKISNILSQLNWSMLSHKLKVPNPIYIMRSIFWIRIFLMAMLQILYSGLTIGFRMKICSTLNSLQKKLWAILWLAQGERCKALQRLN